MMNSLRLTNGSPPHTEWLDAYPTADNQLSSCV